MPADEHSVWPHGVGGYLRMPQGQANSQRTTTLAGYLAALEVPPRHQLLGVDANLRSHRGVRLTARTLSDDARTVVHWLDGYLVDETHVPPRTAGFITACGHIISLSEGVRTARAVSCTTPECAYVAQKHERPATVATPSGPCHGGAARKTPRPDATGNCVAIRPDEDSFRSVKSTAANRVNGQPRSQVATAGEERIATHATTSSARAGRPSKGEPRVLESVAPDG